MGELLTHTWEWQFQSPPEIIWSVLADTARFNEAAKLPKHDIEETPQADGSVLYLGRGQKGPFHLEWRERPVNWVAGQWFEHCREFRRGPLETLCARFELRPEGEGCSGRYTVEASASNLLGEAILRSGFFPSAGRSFGALARSADRFGRGEQIMPFDYEAPQPTDDARSRAESLAEQIENSGYGHGLAGRLIEHIFTGQEVDVGRIRPLALARYWTVPERDLVECCLEATRAGLLELRWDVLCPRCRTAKAVVASLDALPKGAHCETCNIDYDRDFSRNVELSFRPAPGVRRITQGEYCLFGPMSTPHIRVHLTLEPAEQRTIELDLPTGAYRLRTLEAGPEVLFDHTGGPFPKVIAETDAMIHEPGGRAGEIELINRCALPKTLIIEEQPWRRDALTADRVTAMQAFRDLFSDQVLRPGDEVSIRRVTLMFTDLGGSTALYNEIGDAAAYQLVRDHFALLASCVSQHDGAIVKTIGDAVMAVFAEPVQGFEAGLAVQDGIAAFNARYPETPVAIKLGLHVGPCIAVTLNGRLDYFGGTVNMAARLQSQSVGGDMVLSKTIASDPSVAERLAERAGERESATLKGFEEPVPFFRIRF